MAATAATAAINAAGLVARSRPLVLAARAALTATTTTNTTNTTNTTKATVIYHRRWYASETKSTRAPSAAPLFTNKSGERTQSGAEGHANPNPRMPFFESTGYKEFIGMTGAEIIHEILSQRGVSQVFGYPGGAILPVFDAIHDSDKFSFVLPRHEQGGGHMAEGYARATGKPGVLIVTSGPGATNTITPMQDAMMDGTPLVVLAGQVPSQMLGTDAFQEADTVGLTRSCTKWNVTVKNVRDLPRYLHYAFDIATSGRPGPVLIDLPKDVTASTLTQTPRAPTVNQQRHAAATFGADAERRAPASQLRRVAHMLNTAQRPIIYAGQGVIQARACEELAELSERYNIPVTTTLQGMGAFDELNDRSLYMLGMHGHAPANYAMQDADLILALGARFDDRVTGRTDAFAPGARRASTEGRGGIVHFEVDSKNLNKIIGVDEGVVGDLGVNLRLLLEENGDSIEHPERTDWYTQIKYWKEKYPFTYDQSEAEGAPLKPQHVIKALNDTCAESDRDVYITTGVGCHQMWAAQWFRWRHPRQMITSGGSGTMGYGLPAAIGAQTAHPDAIVVDIDGDASLLMTCMELITAAQYNIPVKVLLLNNDFQGMVKQWQDLFYDERYSHTTMFNPDFVKMVEAMGVRGMSVDSASDLDAVMKDFVEYRAGPVLLNAKIPSDEHVYPMVPAGAPLHEMVHHPSQR
eukprot:UC1_evm1s1976